MFLMYIYLFFQPYAPTPKPYEPTPKPYEPTPKPYEPPPPPYEPPHQTYEPTPPPPQSYEDELYQPYKPEPESPPYYKESKYKHFPIVEDIPIKTYNKPVTPKPYVPPTPKTYDNYRFPKKQEFSNFPAYNNNPYNDLGETPNSPPKEDVKRKIQSDFGGGATSNFVTPPDVKKNNKERQPVNPLDK